MDIILYGISGILLTLLFQSIDRYLSSHIFSNNTLVIGRFVSKYPFFASLLPLTVSLFLTFATKSQNDILYILPGLVCSFCIIWPKISNPELIPTEYIEKKTTLHMLYCWVIITFTIFSYVGGLLGRRYLVDYLMNQPDPSKNYITWVFIGTAMIVIKRYIKL